MTSHSARRPLRHPAMAAAIMLAVVASTPLRSYSQVPDARPGIPTSSVLDGYIRDALRANLALAQESLDEDRATAEVREARALRLPTLAFTTRRSETRGALDFGELVNPAYRALNQLTGSNAFPTNVGLTLPFAQETRLRLAQPLYQPAIGAGIRAASAARDAQSAGVRAPAPAVW